MKYISFFALLLAQTALGQQVTLPAQYWYNLSDFNPANAGVAYQHQAGISYRAQWTEIDGAQDAYGYYNTRLKQHHGLGVNIHYGEIGYSAESQISVAYNYQFQLKQDRVLSLGIAPGFGHTSYHGVWTPPQAQWDASLPVSGRYDHVFANFGAAFKTKNLNAGIGVKNVEFANNQNAEYNYSPHYFANVQAKLFFGSRSNYESKTGAFVDALFVTDAVKSTAQFDFRIEFLKYLTGMVGVRTNKDLLFGLGGQAFNHFRAMYSVEYSHVSTLNEPLFSHQFSLIYFVK